MNDPQPGRDGSPNRPRILLVKLSAVGDVVHALPALHALRTHLPHAHIGWVAHPGPANLLEGHPELDELILLPRRPRQYGGLAGFARLVKTLRSQGAGWDWAIDLQGLTKSGLVALISGARQRVGFAGKASRELNGMLMNYHVQPTARQVVRMNIELLQPLGVPTDAPAVATLPVHHDDAAYITAWQASSDIVGERFLVLDPFAGWETKLWPVQHWIDLAAAVREKTGLRSLVFYGPDEHSRAAQLTERIPGAIMAPETTLRQYVALLRQCAGAMVAGDTGPMHIAAACGVPGVALYGPSDKDRNSPCFENARFIALQDEAHPYARTFRRRYPDGYTGPGCMDSLTPDRVMDKLAHLLS